MGGDIAEEEQRHVPAVGSDPPDGRRAPVQRGEQISDLLGGNHRDEQPGHRLMMARRAGEGTTSILVDAGAARDDDGVDTEDPAGSGIGGAVTDIDVVADTELGGLDPYDSMDAEAQRVARFLESLDPGDWEAPTRCEGWSRRDLVGHLVGTEDYHRACLDDALGALVDAGMAAGATDVGSFNAWMIDERAGRDAAEIVAEWTAANAENRRRMRERDGGTMATMVGQYPVRWQAFHVASELATHADDLGVPVDDHDAEGRLEWRARFSRFALAESGRSIDADVSALPAGELVEGVAGRLPSDHPLAAVLTTMP